MFSSTKEKMISGAADLISRRGVAATSLRDVVHHTGTPRGSLSHHFPGGKQQMLEEAVQYADEAVAGPLSALLQERGPVEGLHAFIAWWRRILEASDFVAGCPVLAVAIEPRGATGAQAGEDDAAHERLRSLVHGAFSRWQAIFADSLVRAGVADVRAKRLAALVVASVEGTVAMCRAAGSREPLDCVAEELHSILQLAVAQAPTGQRVSR
jgi:AcrR family transcriptional regulator